MLLTENQSLAYHPVEWYPAMQILKTHWQEIRDEAKFVLNEMAYLSDDRTRHESWRVLPLLPEPEDASVFPTELVQFAQSKAPFTYNLLKDIPSIKAFMFSSLAAHAHIGAHKHDNPSVTGMLGLQCSGESFILNGGERRDFKEGEVIIFDYTMMHEVVNNSDEERIVLLVLFDNVLG